MLRKDTTTVKKRPAASAKRPAGPGSVCFVLRNPETSGKKDPEHAAQSLVPNLG